MSLYKSNESSMGGRYHSEETLRRAGFRHIGKNVKIHERASIYGVENISIGDNIQIDDFVVIVGSNSIEIGSYVHIGAFSFLSGGGCIVMEDFTGLSQGVRMYSASDNYSGTTLTNPTVPSEFAPMKKAPVILRRHVIIGSTSVILPGVEIGTGSSVGALSLVNKSLPEWGVFFGSPVKRIGRRKKSLLDVEKRLMHHNEENA